MIYTLMSALGPIAPLAAAHQLRCFKREAKIDFGGSHKKGTQPSWLERQPFFEPASRLQADINRSLHPAPSVVNDP
jgi:hypothetical protein